MGKFPPNHANIRGKYGKYMEIILEMEVFMGISWEVQRKSWENQGEKI